MPQHMHRLSRACYEESCNGINDPNGGPGICRSGNYAGCPCASVCGTPTNCDDGECQGVNLPGGNLGYCTTSVFQGCFCESICPDSDIDCASNGCEGGSNGVCTAGPYKGCSCGSYCSNLYSQKCNIGGCKGVNYPAFGFGVCTGNFAGCLCLMTCSATGGGCYWGTCKGINGVCSSGDYNGCSVLSHNELYIRHSNLLHPFSIRLYAAHSLKPMQLIDIGADKSSKILNALHLLLHDFIPCF
jgi:hypothetical protein